MMQTHAPIPTPPRIRGVVASANHARRAPRAHRAFTIVELLVVISIIALVMIATIGTLSAMQSGSRESAGYNTVAVAASAARRLATQNKADFDPLTAGEPFQGTAAIFTNTGDIRIVENDSDLNQIYSDTDGSHMQYGYKDVAGRDYIRIPSRVGIVGIARGNIGLNGLRLMAPPFAIRFNQHGNLIAGGFGTGSTQFNVSGPFNVHYDGDYDGNIDPTNSRPTGYNPSSTPDWDSTAGKYELPFEVIDTVIGVIIFEDDGTYDLSADSSDRYINDANRNRILENGKVVFFSRYTGAPLRTDF